MATTKKTTTASTAAKRKVATKTTAVQKAQSNDSNMESIKAEVPTPKKTYNQDTPIPCRSVQAGTMVFIGPKTQMPYTWYSENDVVYLEYQDLMSAIMSRSSYVMTPLFIIEDEELIKDPRCAEIRIMYSKIGDLNNISEILNMSNDDFKNAIMQAPSGIQQSVKSEISTRVANGTFDSVQKIRIVDEVLGTEIAKLLI